VTVADVVASSYRGRPRHSYLLTSQKGGPLAARSFHEIFERINRRLSDRARKALADRGKAGVSAHDLRHTSAVHRLRRYLDTGDGIDKAIEKLRVFFGWSKGSDTNSG
jgi:integrase